MSQMHDSPNGAPGKGGSDKDELERLLLQGVTLHQPSVEDTHAATLPGEDDDEDTQIFQDSDVQGALGLFAEAALPARITATRRRKRRRRPSASSVSGAARPTTTICADWGSALAPPRKFRTRWPS